MCWVFLVDLAFQFRMIKSLAIPIFPCIPKNQCHLHHQHHLLAALAEPLRLQFVKSSADLTWKSHLKMFTGGIGVDVPKWCGIRFWQNRVSQGVHEGIDMNYKNNCWASYWVLLSMVFTKAHQAFLKLAHLCDGKSLKSKWTLEMTSRWVFPKIGYLQSSILMGFSITNHPFWGTPIVGNTQIVGISSTSLVTTSWKLFSLTQWLNQFPLCKPRNSSHQRPWARGEKILICSIHKD